MCGIAGIISPVAGAARSETLKRMTDAIEHRGPDAAGHWTDTEGRVALGHRRLSILDLSDCGAQPMHFLDRYTIVFNGEIYNFIELRERLGKKGFGFRSHSDTEVILALYHDAGTACLSQLDGMFAFAIYDKQEQSLFIARDRFGEKPFYYAYGPDGSLHFGSEMKALWAAGISRNINRPLLGRYLTQGALTDPRDATATFYSGIFKLPAAHYARIDCNRPRLEATRYWSIDPAHRNNDITPAEAAQELYRLLLHSTKLRLRADVPLGSSLSGGLDSSIIVSLLDRLDADQAMRRMTFSAQFPGFEKDESRYQQIIIDNCKVEPHLVEPTAESMLANLPRIMRHQEEPFVSASICAQFEVYGLARSSGVTVCLDGQGADEILGGYHAYLTPFFNGLRSQNRALHDAEYAAYQELQRGNSINATYTHTWKDGLKQLLPAGLMSRLGQLRRGSADPAALLSASLRRDSASRTDAAQSAPDLQAALYHDTMHGGLENLLRYADRNAMAFSLEVRLPFLYHTLVEFIFSLPDHYKIHDGWTKWILREAFKGIIPEPIIWRRDKIGYEPPQQAWMRTAPMQTAVSDAATALCDLDILKPMQPAQLSPDMQWRVYAAAQTLF